tara:strand:- start:460 stop:954 length:495 start_codon:yes stop_codon:yes gene_type:complete
MNNLIPCELCNELIHINDYNSHINNCSYQYENYYVDRYNSITNFIQNLPSIARNNNISHSEFNNNISNFMNMVINNNYTYNFSYEELSNIGDTIGTQNNGFTLDEIKLKFKSIPILEKKECPICLDDIKTKCIELNCNHIFCSECLTEWLLLHKNCPICKNELN